MKPRRRWPLLIILLLALAAGSPTGRAAPPDRLDPALRVALGQAAPGPALRKDFKATRLLTNSPTETVSVLVQLEPGATSTAWLPPGAHLRAQVGDVAAVTVPLAALKDLADARGVRYVRADRPAMAYNDVSVPQTGAPLIHAAGRRGEGVIVAIVDTGIDWTHPDFIDAQGRTRLKALLDMSDPGDRNGDGNLDGPVYGGRLYTEDEINAGLADAGLALVGGGGPIPDNAPDGIVLPLSVLDDTPLRSLAVSVRIQHPYRSDLRLRLMAPWGDERDLLPTQVAVGGTDVYATFEVSGWEGRAVRGVWRLQVADLFPHDEGRVVSWMLHLNQPVRAMDRVGHGTHVAGTAAGNGLGSTPPGRYAGMAPAADIVAVKATRHDDGGFYESDQIAALAFVEAFATQRGQPFVINMSLGTPFGPHDGTAANEIAIDALTASDKRGRAVTVSAGNDGSVDSHAAARVARGQSADLGFVAPGGGSFVADMWFNGRVRVGVRRPSGAVGSWVDATGGDGCSLVEGGAEVCLFFGGPHPMSGAYEVQAYFYNLRSGDPWALIVAGDDERPTRVDAWATTLGAGWTTGVERAMRVSMPGTARGALTVGAYTSRADWPAADGGTHSVGQPAGALAAFSSDGPTRDGRLKPDLVAPGQPIISSLSAWAPRPFSLLTPGGRHFANQGTSMAAPHVAGAAALLLQGDPTLNLPALRALLMAGARRDGWTGVTPNPRWGAGKLDVAAADALARIPRPEHIFLPLITQASD